MRKRGAALFAVLLTLIPGTPAPAPRYLYTVLNGPTSTIWSSDGPRPIAQVPHLDGYGIRGRLSPDGTQLAYTLLASSAELWVLRLSERSSRRLLSDIDVHSAPVWSPDGAHVTARRGTALFSVDLAGQVTTVRPESPVQGIYPFAWRPEGLYYAVIDGGTDVYRDRDHILRAGEGIARDFRFDGNRLVYQVEVGAAGLQERQAEFCRAGPCGPPGRLAGDKHVLSRVEGPPPYTGLPSNAEFIGWLP